MIPAYVTVTEIAKASGWSTRYTRRFLRRAGILELNGRRYVVGEGRLRERLPELFERLYAAEVERELSEEPPK